MTIKSSLSEGWGKHSKIVAYEDIHKDNLLKYHKIEGNYQLIKNNMQYTSYNPSNHHRQIYEKKRKCTLLRGTLIHHINCNKSDNSLRNLIMVNTKQHGQLHHVLALSISKSKKNEDRFQIISDTSPNICFKDNHYYYLFEYSYYYNGYKLDKTHKDYVFAESLSQLKYVCDLCGLYTEGLFEIE